MSQKKMCCVMGCPSKQANSKDVLYVYPPSTSQRYKRWLTLFPNSFVLHSDKDNYICRRHFTFESFDEEFRLKHSADPTINIDTSYAQDQILRTFLAKVIYEWSLRNKVSDEDTIAQKAAEAKDLLGMASFKAERHWIFKFNRLRRTNMHNGIRFGTGGAESLQIFDIIRDLRHYLPSNFALPIDLMNVTSEGDKLEVKNECYSDNEENEDLESKPQADLIKIEECAAEPAPIKTEVPVPPQALDTYQEALDVLKPLAAYITRIGNLNALVRLREIEAVVKQVIQAENRPRKGVKRSR